MVKAPRPDLKRKAGHSIQRPPAQHLAYPGNETSQGVIERHVLSALRRRHHVDKEQPRRTDCPTDITNTLKDSNAQRKGQAPLRMVGHDKPQHRQEQADEQAAHHHRFAPIAIRRPAPEVASHQPAGQRPNAQPHNIAFTQTDRLVHKKGQKGEQWCKANNDQPNAQHIASEICIATYRQYPSQIDAGRRSPPRTTWHLGIRPDRDKARDQAGADQDHKAGQASRLFNHKTSDHHHEKTGDSAKEVTGGVIFPPYAVRNILLHPRKGGGIGRCLTERKTGGDAGNKERGDACAKGGGHPRR